MDPRAARTRDAAVATGRALLHREGVDAITHARIADASGIGRRTLYRHWPDAASLLHDVMAAQDVTHPPRTGDLRQDLVAHLTTLAMALRAGGLAYVVCVLGERARRDPAFEVLRRTLTDAGCRPAEEILSAAAADGRLPSDVDVAQSMALLEGPVFYAELIRRAALADRAVDALVARYLAAPPRGGASVCNRPIAGHKSQIHNY